MFKKYVITCHLLKSFHAEIFQIFNQIFVKMFVQIFEKIFAQNYPISDFVQVLVIFLMKISLQYCSTFQSNLQTKSTDQTLLKFSIFFRLLQIC